MSGCSELLNFPRISSSSNSAWGLFFFFVLWFQIRAVSMHVQWNVTGLVYITQCRVLRFTVPLHIWAFISRSSVRYCHRNMLFHHLVQITSGRVVTFRPWLDSWCNWQLWTTWTKTQQEQKRHAFGVLRTNKRSAACRLTSRCIETDLAWVGDRTLHRWCHLGNLPPEKLPAVPPTVINVNHWV